MITPVPACESLEGRTLLTASHFYAYSLGISPASVSEGGSVTVTFGVAELNNSGTVRSTNVHYAFSGTSTAGTDFTDPDGGSVPVVIGDHGTLFGSSTVVIPIARDNLVEGDETLTVTITGVDNGEVGNPFGGSPPGPVTATIHDDPPRVSIAASADATESDENGNPILGSFTLTRTRGDIAQALDVPVTVDGSSTATSDLYTMPATAHFAANSTTATLPVTPKEINHVMGDKTLTVDVPTTFTGGATSQATIAIHNTDDCTITVTPPPNGPLTVNDKQPATVSVVDHWGRPKMESLTLGYNSGVIGPDGTVVATDANGTGTVAIQGVAEGDSPLTATDQAGNSGTSTVTVGLPVISFEAGSASTLAIGQHGGVLFRIKKANGIDNFPGQTAVVTADAGAVLINNVSPTDFFGEGGFGVTVNSVNVVNGQNVPVNLTVSLGGASAQRTLTTEPGYVFLEGPRDAVNNTPLSQKIHVGATITIVAEVRPKASDAKAMPGLSVEADVEALGMNAPVEGLTPTTSVAVTGTPADLNSYSAVSFTFTAQKVGTYIIHFSVIGYPDDRMTGIESEGIEIAVDP